MSRLFDRAANEWVDVPEGDVTSLVAKGTHAFETGIDIPVVAPNGEIGSIPSDKAERAFREGGYRWQTAEDLKQWERAKNDAIMDAHTSAGNAFVEGVVRGGTLGLSDVVAPAIVGMAGGDSDAAKTLLNESRDRHAFAAGTGQLVGAIGNPLLRAGSAAVGEAAGEAAALKGLSALPAGTSAKAAQIVEKLATAGVGSAVEGAFFGMGDGISEAALGDPSEIAENLATGPLAGAILGGVTGLGFAGTKMAATPLKGLISKVTQSADELTQAAMRKTARGALVPALSLQGEKELASITREMTEEGSSIVRQAYFEGGADVASKLADKVRGLELQAKAEAKQLKRELGYYIAERPKEIREAIKAELNDATGDLSSALKSSYAKYEGERLSLESRLRSDRSPSTYAADLDQLTDNVVKKLESIGDRKAALKAKEISEYYQAQKVANNIRSAQSPDGLLTSGQEMLISNELRDRARNGLLKLNGQGQRLAKDYIDDLTHILHENPQYGAHFKRLDQQYDAFDAFRGFATGVNKNKSLAVKSSILEKVKNDPEFANEFDGLLNRFADLAPDMQAYRDAGKNLAAKETALRSLEAKIKTVRDRSYGRLDVDDLEQIVKEFSAPNMLGKVDELRTITQSLQDQGEGVFTKALRLQRALGHDIDPQIEKYIQHEKGFEKLAKLAPQGVDDNYMKTLMKRLAARGARSAAGALIGSQIGDSPGAAIGAALGAGLVTGKLINPTRTLKALTLLERQSNKAFKAVETATQAAVDALTRDEARKIGVIAMAQSPRSLSERREDFKRRAEYLNKLTDPAQRMAAIQERIGELPGAPTIQAHTALQYARTADFLTSKLPTDPLAGQSLMSHASPWEPSDHELATFERYADAAENPLSVMDNIVKGTVSPEEIETLQVLYPGMYRRLQNGIVNAIIDPNTRLSYAQRIQIGTLLNIPADASLAPQFVASMQQNFADTSQSSNAGAGHPSGTTPAKFDLNIEATQTPTQRISEA